MHKTKYLGILLPPVMLALVLLPFVTWGFTDDDVFILYYLAGNPYPPPIWPSIGRFFPLAHQEWRLVPWITEAWMFHGIALLGYAIFCVFVWSFVRTRKLDYFGYLFLVTLPPTIVSFSNVIVLERNQLMFVAVFLYCYRVWLADGRVIFGLLALVCANAALYYKEPTFLFIGGFAAVQALRLFEQNAGTTNRFHKHWVCGVLLMSCLVFLGAYIRLIEPSILVSKHAYAGMDLSSTKVLSALVRWTIKEPLIIPLMVAGLLLAIVRYRSKREFNLDSLAIWFGSFLYFLALCLSGGVSKYYAALPLFGFALHFYCELRHVTGRAFSNKILAALVFVNVFMWAPSVIYKFDWTNRNFEVTEHLVVYLSETEAKKVVIENSSQSQWDAKMLIIYSKHIADQNVDFYCWWDIADTTLYDPSCPMYLNDKKTALRLNLGSVDSERTATLAYDGKVLWQYESLWTKWVPSKLRDVLAPHYNIW